MNLDIVKQNFVLLSNELNLHVLLPILKEKNLITLYDYESLQSKSNIQRNQEFLLNLDMYGEDCEQEFYKYLESLEIRLSYTKTHFVADNSYGGTYDKIEFTISKRINATAVAAKLYEYGFLRSEKLENVIAAPTRYKKTAELLHDFHRSTKRPGFITCFLRTLKEVQPTLYKHVCEKHKNIV